MQAHVWVIDGIIRAKNSELAEHGVQIVVDGGKRIAKGLAQTLCTEEISDEGIEEDDEPVLHRRRRDRLSRSPPAQRNRGLWDGATRESPRCRRYADVREMRTDRRPGKRPRSAG